MNVTSNKRLLALDVMRNDFSEHPRLLATYVCPSQAR